MRKKIRLLVILGTFFLLLLILIIGVYVYRVRSEDIPVEVPITSSGKVLELSKSLSDKGFRLEDTPFEIKGTIMASISGSLVLFSSSKSLKTQVTALQLLTQTLKIKDEKPKEIDLRFDKVVLRF